MLTVPIHEGRILQANTASRELSGCDAAQLAGKIFANLTAAPDLPQAMRRFVELVEGRLAERRVEWHEKAKHGHQAIAAKNLTGPQGNTHREIHPQTTQRCSWQSRFQYTPPSLSIPDLSSELN